MGNQPVNEAAHREIDDVEMGEGVVVRPFTNLYGCRIGANSRIGAFVEIQAGARVGASCKIQSHSFLCEGVTIGDRVFVGHGVTFVNDRRPRASHPDGRLLGPEDWRLEPTVVEDGVAIGSGATILGGVRLGREALIGAGSVVTKDIAPGLVVAGNPARPLPGVAVEQPDRAPAGAQ
jgi:UDP-2-acetamido-3-amino-2,3-dideoxy-glucuronate N-acetyltransferase